MRCHLSLTRLQTTNPRGRVSSPAASDRAGQCWTWVWTYISRCTLFTSRCVYNASFSPPSDYFPFSSSPTSTTTTTFSTSPNTFLHLSRLSLQDFDTHSFISRQQSFNLIPYSINMQYSIIFTSALAAFTTVDAAPIEQRTPQ